MELKELLEHNLKQLSSNGEKGNPIIVRANKSWKISNEVKGLQLIEKIITPLEKIIYLYVPTECYNYVPGTKNDCWNFMEEKIEEIYGNLNSLVFLSDDEYERVWKIIDTIHTFVRGYSGVDAITDSYWFEVNPNLRFFHSCYTIPFHSDLIPKPPFSYTPNNQDELQERYFYFAYLHYYSNARNYKWDKYDTSDYAPENPEDIMLMHELAYTLRLVFINRFPELCE